MKKQTRPGVRYLFLLIGFVLFLVVLYEYNAVTTQNIVISKMLTSTPAPDVPAANMPHLDSRVGLSVGENFSILNKEELDKRLDDIVSLGIGQLRFDLSWDSVQHEDLNSYDWQKIDTLVTEARSRHLTLLPIIAYTPDWARPDNCAYDPKCAPADPQQFANFAREAVKRYAPQGVHTWEIWNEPNLRMFWKPRPNATNYATLLQKTYNEIKAQDSTALVISGGLGPASTSDGNISPLDYLSSLYSAGVGKYFDAVGYHPYTYPLPPSDTRASSAWSQISATRVSLRSIMTKNGDNTKQIWLTEFGAPTGGPGTLATVNDYRISSDPDHVTDELQSKILQDAVTMAHDNSLVGPLFIYSYKDLGTSNNSNENFFGIIHYDGTPKASYEMLKELLPTL